MDLKVTKREVLRDRLMKQLTATPISGKHFVKIENYHNADDNEFKKLEELLKKTNCDVQVIEFSKIVINQTKAECIARGLYENDSVLELRLTNCKLHPKELQIIADAIARHGTLRLFELHGVNLTSEPARALGQALMQNISLRRLCIFDCGFSDLCMETMAEGIRMSVSLEKIEFQNALFEERGLTILVDALSSQFNCKKIRLGGIRFNEVMCRKMADFFSNPRCKLERICLHEMDTNEANLMLVVESLNSLKDL